MDISRTWWVKESWTEIPLQPLRGNRRDKYPFYNFRHINLYWILWCRHKFLWPFIAILQLPSIINETTKNSIFDSNYLKRCLLIDFHENIIIFGKSVFFFCKIIFLEKSRSQIIFLVRLTNHTVYMDYTSKKKKKNLRQHSLRKSMSQLWQSYRTYNVSCGNGISFGAVPFAISQTDPLIASLTTVTKPFATCSILWT